MSYSNQLQNFAENVPCMLCYTIKCPSTKFQLIQRNKLLNPFVNIAKIRPKMAYKLDYIHAVIHFQYFHFACTYLHLVYDISKLSTLFCCNYCVVLLEAFAINTICCTHKNRLSKITGYMCHSIEWKSCIIFNYTWLKSHKVVNAF